LLFIPGAGPVGLAAGAGAEAGVLDEAVSLFGEFDRQPLNKAPEPNASNAMETILPFFMCDLQV
jgi:hypothetical protein